MSHPPKFSPDWKSKEHRTIRNDISGWPIPVTELRVRTAIDPAARRAKDNQLFAYELINDPGLNWYSKIDLSGVPDIAAKQLWALIRSGVTGVGKTKATVTVSPKPWTPSVTQDWSKKNEYLRITLQSPALLTDPSAPAKLDSTNPLFDSYAAYFSTQSGQALALHNFFAEQELQGGKFLFHKFQVGRADKKYRPYLVTKPGSVFVLEVKDADRAETLILDWLKRGLPAADFISSQFSRPNLEPNGDHWKNNPFHRNNGFGEIAINLVLPLGEVHNA